MVQQQLLFCQWNNQGICEFEVGGTFQMQGIKNWYKSRNVKINKFSAKNSIFSGNRSKALFKNPFFILFYCHESRSRINILSIKWISILLQQLTVYLNYVKSFFSLPLRQQKPNKTNNIITLQTFLSATSWLKVDGL